MATLIVGREIGEAVDTIITGSARSLFLASRDLTLPESLKNKVRGTGGLPDIRLYYRDHFIVGGPPDITLLKEHKNIRVFVCELLHMNIFMNESAGIVTSYNLLEAPGRPPVDLGVFFRKTADDEMFSRTVDTIRAMEAESRLQTDFPGSPGGPGITGKERKRGGDRTGPDGGGLLRKFFHEAIGGGGYCITCGDPMSYQRRTPFCPHCQRIRNGRPEPGCNGYYCHNCGTAEPVTLSVPFCRRCLLDSRR